MARRGMRRIRRPARLPGAAWLLLAAVLAAALPAFPASPRASAPDAIPPPAGHVTDAAGVMGGLAAKTEALCRDVERRTTVEIAVLTVRTTGPLPAQQYAQQVFDLWKIGKKGKDNGVLVLLAVDDRAVWIATGYGVEELLPDGKVGEIRDEILVPHFREGKYGEGIYRGVERIGAVLAGERPAPGGGTSRKDAFPPALLLAILIIAAFVLMSLLSGPLGTYRRRGGRRYGGGFPPGGFGGGGFGGGGFGGFGGGSSGGGGAGGRW